MSKVWEFKYFVDKDEKKERDKANYVTKDSLAIARSNSKTVSDLANGIDSPELELKKWMMKQ